MMRNLAWAVYDAIYQFVDEHYDAVGRVLGTLMVAWVFLAGII